MATNTEVKNAAFNEAYASLNAAQKEAVDTIEGPVMVIAGPGTGKTQVLTLRIANILLQTDTKPENILALTFTDAGAKAMRQRLHTYIGAEAYKVNIFTFHGFAEHVIRQYPDAYTRVIGGRPASDLEKVAFIERILESGHFTLLRPLGNPLYYVQKIISTLQTLKKEYITPDRFAELIAQQENELAGIEKIHQKGAHKGKIRGEYIKKEKDIAKNRELLMVYRQYQELLKDGRLYDFEDMIIETVEALQQNEDLLRDLQEMYQYVLADEHQDVNGSQNAILELLCNYHERPNLFVVGDEKQAIYRFQGASLENFLYFEDVFKGTKIISLQENYRSGQTILDAAHSMIAVDEGELAALRLPLHAAQVSSSLITQRTFSHQAVEDAWVVREVAALLQKGVEAQEIAVIVRTNSEVESFAALLRKEGIAVEASADGDILDHPLTTAIQMLLDATVHPHRQDALFALLHAPYWGIGASDLVRVAQARSHGASLEEILEDKEKLQSLSVADVKAAQRVVEVLAQARARSLTEGPHRVLEFLLRESGFLDYVLAHDPHEGVRVVRRVYDEVEKLVLQDARTTLQAVSDVFALYKAHNLPLQAPYIRTNSDAVQLLTAHKSKGLEYEAVFVPHLTDNLWGGKARRTYFDIPLTKHLDADDFDPLDDERRLLYVAMTRAKRQLYFSCAEQNTQGKELIASRLLAEIDRQHMEESDTAEEEQRFSPIDALQKTLSPLPIDPALLASHLEHRGLSATSLNNYLRSPWDYLYRNVLQIPEIKTLPLLFGTAIHGVMEYVTAAHAASKVMPSASAIKAQLETQLSRLPITDGEFTQLHEKGLSMLLAYVEHIKHDMPDAFKAEFAVRATLQTGLSAFPEVTLTGKLDRIDLDQDGNIVQVLDYKTGKPKTRNVIEGKTKGSNGDYKRQLVFYALLLSLYEDGKYACRTGKLSFIEPDSKGVIHEEVFEITQEEIDELKAELLRVVEEIVTGSFLQQPCDETQSQYCHLAQQL